METKHNNREKSYGTKADAFLHELYSSVGATTSAQKINVLQMQLGGQSNFHALGGEISDDQKLACLEYEFLSDRGLIQLTLA